MSIPHQLMHRMFARPGPALGHIGGALMAVGNGPTELRVVSMAGLTRHDRVLVVGAGPGLGVAAAARRASAVVALDPSPTMTCAITRRIARRPLCSPVLVGLATAEATGCQDGAFDVALSVNNIHLWSTVTAGFTELRRVLKTDGRLIVSSHLSSVASRRQLVLRDVRACGFDVLSTSTWRPPTMLAGTAWQFRAVAV